MKTHDEIKKGLGRCALEGEKASCRTCPYEKFGNGSSCIPKLTGDALAYIQQLERERDAAVELLHGFCGACANEGKHEICVECSRRLPFEPEDKDDYWQWRGVQEIKV